MSRVSGADQSTSVSSAQHLFKDLIIHSNLHILLVALGLLLGTITLAEIPLNPNLLITACCGALLIYQVDRLFIGGEEDAINHPERTHWLREHRGLALLLFVSFLGWGGLAALKLEAHTIALGFVMLVAGVIYLLPVLPGRLKLKGIWFVKPVMIATAWSLGTVVFPVWDAGLLFQWELLSLFFYRWFFILSNVVLSDWHDRTGDELAGHTSLATMLNELQLRQLAGFTALTSIGIGVGTGLLAAWPAVFYVDLIGPAIMLLICSRPLKLFTSYVLILDLVVAWPLFTAMMAWLF